MNANKEFNRLITNLDAGSCANLESKEALVPKG